MMLWYVEWRSLARWDHTSMPGTNLYPAVTPVMSQLPSLEMSCLPSPVNCTLVNAYHASLGTRLASLLPCLHSNLTISDSCCSHQTAVPSSCL